MTEPKVSFEINQKVLVFLEDQPLDYIPCIPVSDGDEISRIPHKSWIKYRGLVNLYGDLYMRFMYEDTQVYIGLCCLPFLENIPQRNPWTKRFIPKQQKSKVKAIKAKGLRNKRKPGVHFKKKKVI